VVTAAVAILLALGGAIAAGGAGVAVKTEEGDAAMFRGISLAKLGKTKGTRTFGGSAEALIFGAGAEVKRVAKGAVLLRFAFFLETGAFIALQASTDKAQAMGTGGERVFEVAIFEADTGEGLAKGDTNVAWSTDKRRESGHVATFFAFEALDTTNTTT
jgi:hypothetical protein